MGKVIKISDFIATENIGVVTIIGNTNINLTGISITTKPTSIVNSIQLSVTYAPTNATNKAVTWSSSNTSIATVSSTGLVTVIAAGTVTISVISQANNLLTDSVTIACSLSNVEPTSVSISGSSSGIEGSEIQLSATVLPTNATNKLVTWSSSNTSIATISSSGLVSLLSVGTVTITATSQANSGIYGTKSIECTSSTIAVESISISGDVTVNAGSTLQLTATVLPTNATNKAVTWLSSNTSIATVDQNGLVTAIAAGSVTITATSQSNTSISGTLSITVSASSIADKMIISFTRNTEGIDYTMLQNGEYINVAFPNGSSGGVNKTLKDSLGNDYATLVHNTQLYPSLGYTWQVFNYHTNTLSGNLGTYPDLYFSKGAYIQSSIAPKRGIIYMTGIPNGTYKAKIYPCDSQDFSAYPAIISASKYEINDSGAIACTFNPYNNTTQYIEIQFTVTDGTLLLMLYTSASYSNCPWISIFELNKI